MVKPRPLSERFWEKVRKTSGCWNWTAAKNHWGYGLIGTEGRRIDRAHRISWRMHFGEIPPGLFVCHKCDNPACVRPDHLFLGSNQDNVTDMHSKHRAPVSEQHGKAVFTNQQVKTMRELYKSGMRQEDIAERFHTSQRNISRIVLGYFYKEAGGPIASKKQPIVLRGEQNGNARLTYEQVLEIRFLHRSGAKGYELASKFKVSPSTISNVVNGKMYQPI